MKRITVLSAFYTPFVSGAERAVVETVGRLAGRFSFTVVTARLDRKLPKREMMQGPGGTYEVVRLGLGIKADKWLYMPLAAIWCLRHPADVMHAVMESYAGVALWWYVALSGKGRTVLTLQSGDLDLPEKSKGLRGWAQRKLHPAPDTVTAISTALAERARSYGAKDVRIVPNGVDLEKAASVPRGERPPHRISVIARLSPEKGLPHLLDAMPEILEACPDAELVVVGGGDLEETLKSRSEKLGLDGKVRFTGSLPHEEALAQVADSSVFVLPSLGEGLGIVLIEAQALGVPVIGTDVGGIPDVITHDRTGLLVPPADPTAIVEAVLRIFNDPDAAGRMADAASNELPRYRWDRIAETYADIYLE